MYRTAGVIHGVLDGPADNSFIGTSFNCNLLAIQVYNGTFNCGYSMPAMIDS